MRLPSFFLIATVIMGALHAYIGVRVLPDLPVSEGWRMAGAALLVVSFLLMPMSVVSRGIRRQPLSDILAWAGSLFMGLFSSLLMLTLLRDLVLAGMAVFAPDETFALVARCWRCCSA